jgi:hypothetical protein
MPASVAAMVKSSKSTIRSTKIGKIWSSWAWACGGRLKAACMTLDL